MCDDTRHTPTDKTTQTDLRYHRRNTWPVLRTGLSQRPELLTIRAEAESRCYYWRLLSVCQMQASNATNAINAINAPIAGNANLFSAPSLGTRWPGVAPNGPNHRSNGVRPQMPFLSHLWFDSCILNAFWFFTPNACIAFGIGSDHIFGLRCHRKPSHDRSYHL